MIKNTLILLSAIQGLLLVTTPVTAQITLFQKDNFQSSGTAGWGVGNPMSHPAPPEWIVNGGPTGTLDNFLQVEGFGGGGAGSKPTMFNTTQWAGDYTSAGVEGIEFHYKYLGKGPETMTLRIALEGAAGIAWSNQAVTIAPGTMSPWHQTEISLREENLSAAAETDLASLLSDVNKIWFFHSPSGNSPGNSPALNLRIGYDNIRAVPEPHWMSWAVGGGIGLVRARTPVEGFLDFMRFEPKRNREPLALVSEARKPWTAIRWLLVPPAALAAALGAYAIAWLLASWLSVTYFSDTIEIGLAWTTLLPDAASAGVLVEVARRTAPSPFGIKSAWVAAVVNAGITGGSFLLNEETGSPMEIASGWLAVIVGFGVAWHGSRRAKPTDVHPISTPGPDQM